MNQGVPWSKAEDECLRNFAMSGLAAPEIALAMNRPRSVIRRHAEKLQIKIASGKNAMIRIDRLVELGLKAKK